MKLPETVVELKDVLERNEGGSVKLWSLITTGKFTTSCLESKKIIEYATPGLFFGRPLNQTMIVLYGKTGSGKSSTINRLFDDDALCRVSNNTSETAEVIECIKDLTVIRPHIQPSISAKLSFVDVPGCLDTNSRKEVINSKKIFDFRKFHSALKERTIPSTLAPFNLSSKVYPNSVLFAFNSKDNRTVGPDTDLAKSLKLLKSYELVDYKRPNLIMIGTHACCLGMNKAKYTEHALRVTRDVRKLVHDVLAIQNVPVVFVENEPDDYDLPKDGDFFLLPDGSCSHENLITAMKTQYENNTDALSLLLTSWYFRAGCPDKKTAPKTETVKFNDRQTNLGADKARIAEMMKDLNIGGDFDEIIPVLNFHALGAAYCPVMESLKSHNLFTPTSDEHTLRVENAKFRIPKYVNPFIENKSIFKCISYHSKDEYERSKAEQYSFDAGLKLVVDVSSNGRWTTKTTLTNQETIISMLFEQQVCSIHVDNPQQYVSQEFFQVINDLPSTHDDKSDKFMQFFAKYGTHLVTKECLGGWIKFDCHINQTTFNREENGKIEVKAQGIFKQLVAGGGYSNEDAFRQLQQVGMTDEHITIGGGDPPLVSSIKAITPDVLTKWLASVKKNPSELEHTRVLYPYYNLAKKENRGSLWEATFEYLQSGSKRRIQNTREDKANELEEKAKIAAASSSNCVPGWTSVITMNGPKRVDMLEDFEQVLTIGKLGDIRWTPFYAFVHCEVDKVAGFLVLELVNGKSLTISPEHLMFICDQAGKRADKMARDVMKADFVFYVDSLTRIVEKVQVTRKTVTTSTGIYSPLTMEGTLLVEGVLISSYADIQNFAVAHNAFLPLRLWVRAERKLNKSGRNVLTEGLHPYAKMLIKLRDMASVLY